MLILKRATVLLFSLLILGCSSSEQQKKRPNIILIMLDTLRADHLSFYGYERNTSPTIDAFARENIAYSYATAASPWTPPSVATMFTGLYATSHGMIPPNEREDAKKALKRLDENLDTLAEIFKRNGYQTAAVTPNPWTNQEFGYDQGFDDFQFLPREHAGVISKAGIETIDRLAANDAPFFLYLHYLDPHDPYAPPADFRRKFSGALVKDGRTYSEKMQEYINLYDGEIAFMDSRIARVFDALKTKGLYDDSVIIMLGDHGEQFMEHGDHRHGFKLFNEEVHIPLILKPGRGIQPKVVDQTVSTIDVFPTLLALAGLPLPSYVAGLNLLEYDKLAARPGVMSEIDRHYVQKAFINNNRDKLLMGSMLIDKPLEGDIRDHVLGLYNQHTEDHETKSLTNDALVKELKARFTEVNDQALRNKTAGGAEVTVKDETIDQLKSLGYLH